jgi:hypothetical protein
MFVVDESISEIEAWRLREWRIAVRLIGPDVADKSILDENIIPLLHRLKRPTFFTRDRDFWKASLCHQSYSIVYLDIRETEGEIARYIRRFLRDPHFNTHAKRLGKVVRVHPQGSQFWQWKEVGLKAVKWSSKTSEPLNR